MSKHAHNYNIASEELDEAGLCHISSSHTFSWSIIPQMSAENELLKVGILRKY